jgi:aspartyl protease family protein
MMLGGGLFLVVVGMAALVAFFGRGAIAGIASAEVASFLAFAAVALLITGRTAERARASWGATVTALTLWLVSMGCLGALYTHRAVLGTMTGSFAESIGALEPEAELGTGGEVSVTRRGRGSFVVPARINDRPARFVFDTGASTVVLTHDTAETLGLKPEAMTFRVPVGTANGMALAAPVTLDSLAIGTITLRRVQALIVRSGMLQENLLGQTFLERLSSYEVRGNRLVFRAGRG